MKKENEREREREIHRERKIIYNIMLLASFIHNNGHLTICLKMVSLRKILHWILLHLMTQQIEMYNINLIRYISNNLSVKSQQLDIHKCLLLKQLWIRKNRNNIWTQLKITWPTKASILLKRDIFFWHVQYKLLVQFRWFRLSDIYLLSI